MGGLVRCAAEQGGAQVTGAGTRTPRPQDRRPSRGGRRHTPPGGAAMGQGLRVESALCSRC